MTPHQGIDLFCRVQLSRGSLEGLVGKLDITPQFLREKARKRQLQQLETALSLLITVE